MASDALGEESATTSSNAAADLVARLRRLDSCVVSDALDALGLSGVVDGIGPAWEGAAVAGRALTMQLAAGVAPAGDRPVHLGARAIVRAGPDDVIVVSTQGGASVGSWGGLLSRAASLKLLPGVITEGACRDVDEARTLAFPVFCVGAATRTARGRVHEESVGHPGHLAGVPVETGDLVIADASGVVVVGRAYAERVLVTAEGLLRREAAMIAALEAGTAVDEVLGRSYEDMLRNPT